MIFVDDDPSLSILGTGTEDYYNGAWNFGGQPFAYLHNGAPFIANFERVRGSLLPLPMAHGKSYYVSKLN